MRTCKQCEQITDAYYNEKMSICAPCHLENMNEYYANPVNRARNRRKVFERTTGLLVYTDDSMTVEALYEILRNQDYRCYFYELCRDDTTNLQIDHKVSFSNGGTDTIDNIIFACGGCNRKGRGKTASERHPDFAPDGYWIDDLF